MYAAFVAARLLGIPRLRRPVRIACAVLVFAWIPAVTWVNIGYFNTQKQDGAPAFRFFKQADLIRRHSGECGFPVRARLDRAEWSIDLDFERREGRGPLLLDTREKGDDFLKTPCAELRVPAS
jgi:hypothetical protein